MLYQLQVPGSILEAWSWSFWPHRHGHGLTLVRVQVLLWPTLKYSIVVPSEHLPHNGQWLRSCFKTVSLSFRCIHNDSTLNKTKLQDSSKTPAKCLGMVVQTVDCTKVAGQGSHLGWLRPALCLPVSLPYPGPCLPTQRENHLFSNRWCRASQTQHFLSDIRCLFDYGGHFSSVHFVNWYHSES